MTNHGAIAANLLNVDLCQSKRPAGPSSWIVVAYGNKGQQGGNKAKNLRLT